MTTNITIEFRMRNAGQDTEGRAETIFEAMNTGRLAKVMKGMVRLQMTTTSFTLVVTALMRSQEAADARLEVHGLTSVVETVVGAIAVPTYDV